MNQEFVLVYWEIGTAIMEKQNVDGRGARVIDRLSSDLANSFPGAKGFSPRNLKYMRAFTQAWPDRPLVQEALAELPWYRKLVLIREAGPAGWRDSSWGIASGRIDAAINKVKPLHDGEYATLLDISILSASTPLNMLERSFHLDGLTELIFHRINHSRWTHKAADGRTGGSP